MNAVFNHSQVFAVPAAELFDAMVSRFAEWWGEEASLDPSVGGRVLSQVDGEREEGVVKKFEAPMKLSIELGETLAMMILQESPEGTTLQLLHTRFASGDDRDRYAPNWEARLARLATLVA
ncbi:MAG: SRPBCC domain-containing protein [Myxococcota bacterium]